MTEDTSWIQYVGRPWVNVGLEIYNRHPGTVRLIHPGTMVTADFKTDRLNVQLDHDEIVTKIYFG